jgi:hypothetical protein
VKAKKKSNFYVLPQKLQMLMIVNAIIDEKIEEVFNPVVKR